MNLRIKKPIMNLSEILNVCFTSTSNPRKQRVMSYASYILQKQEEYLTLASDDNLISFEDNIFNGGTIHNFKDDMIWLYDNKFSKLKGPARSYYDCIKLSARNNKCPYCLHRDVTQVDHYLPKASQPVLAITPENLIPSCTDCNKDKLNEDTEIFAHPYFDEIDLEVYLKCYSVYSNGDIVFIFDIEKPQQWREDLFNRVSNQIKSSNLLEFYGTHAIAEYNMIRYSLIRLSKRSSEEDVLMLHLLDLLHGAESEIGINSWQAGLYRCLINDSELKPFLRSF